MNKYKNRKQFHYFHLVDASPWPLFASISAIFLTTGCVMYFHSVRNGSLLVVLGLLLLISFMSFWWRDVIREATFEGHHTSVVQQGLRYGMLLFIVSEIMFFFAFFWAFFHSSLAPVIEIGSIWPPKGIEVYNPWEIPLLNTLILLLSGAAITWSHHAILLNFWSESLLGLGITILLAFFFMYLQMYEYINASFSISDGIYGSTFFMLTGFHGFHVFIGTSFIIVCFFRMWLNHFTSKHHFGFEAAAWYWHFVDVVWLFLFITVYWWGSL